MRLINVETCEVEVFYEGSIPPYAILSHTWGDDEVALQDMHRFSEVRHTLGYKKITMACTQARLDELGHLWVDTCCIDKSSSAELQEAINSMYRWYADAAVCYVFMWDLSYECPYLTDHSGLAHYTDPSGSEPTPWHQAFLRSQWFTRGWTLQELLAPAKVSFFGSTLR